MRTHLAKAISRRKFMPSNPTSRRSRTAQIVAVLLLNYALWTTTRGVKRTKGCSFAKPLLSGSERASFF